MKRLQALMIRFEKPLLIIFGAATLSALLINLDFNLLEANLYDLRMSHGWQTPADPNIVVVALDDATTAALSEFSPLPLNYHVQFLEQLEKLQPRAVGYLIDLNQVNEINPELLKKDWGKKFLNTARRFQNEGIVFTLGTPYDVTGELLPPYPLSTLPHALALIHKDGNVFSDDKITRRALLKINDQPVFHLDLAERIGATEKNDPVRGSYYIAEADAKYFFFRYHGSTAIFPGKASRPSYRTLSFIDILRGNLTPGSLRGKIVLVGTLSQEDSSDFATTPYSKMSFVNPKILIHANILDSVIHNDGIERAPAWVNWLITFAVTTFVLWWVLNSTPLYGVFATLSLALAFVVFGQVMFQVRGLWLRESQPLVGIFVAYYLVVPYRLIREYKKRWDYQRQNELLTQVEELKTNFLSLVTHDLKTPVARIQGLAEVLLRKSSHLLGQDREALFHIIDSTQELNRFITSILELSKVESNELRLKLESRDINQLIERAVEAFQAHARARKIRIMSELEPLFPIKCDSSLISKVINNLIDNAIKYSPSGSEVRVESHEKNGWVVIAIKDQGIGMSPEERGQLFTRFYRAKNDTTTQITGTGLGLYLTKFFVEAHHGVVEVESEKGEGSTFRIFLPIEAPKAGVAIAKGESSPVQPGLSKRIASSWRSEGRSRAAAVKEKADV